jgi:hypothetical protein
MEIHSWNKGRKKRINKREEKKRPKTSLENFLKSFWKVGEGGGGGGGGAVVGMKVERTKREEQ